MFWSTWQTRVIIGLVAMISLGGIYTAGFIKGGSIARSQCRTEALKAQLQETERQRRAGEAALAEAQKRHEEQTREIATLNAESDAYVAQLQTGNPCLLTDDDVRRLRALDDQ